MYNVDLFLNGTWSPLATNVTLTQAYRLEVLAKLQGRATRKSAI